jgi:D-sedoheptulose 7-phosphate isomerase
MTANSNFIDEYITHHAFVLSKINVNEILNAIKLIRSAIENNKKIITLGNGGSALTSSHLITDWNKMFNIETGLKFRGISLADNIGLVTAYGNDTNFENIFVGQLNSLMDPGDLILGISGSGNSLNIINAINYANANNATTLCFLGYDGGKLKNVSQNYVLIPSFDMQICEDLHLMLGHIVMKSICGIKLNKD